MRVITENDAFASILHRLLSIFPAVNEVDKQSSNYLLKSRSVFDSFRKMSAWKAISTFRETPITVLRHYSARIYAVIYQVLFGYRVRFYCPLNSPLSSS